MDKVQKIREEVEKLKLCTMDEHMKFYSESAEAEYYALRKVEEIIDSMQEEPKFKTGDRIKPVDSCLGAPRTILEVCDGWYVTDQGTLDFEYEDNWEAVEEPVSEDLEKAARSYTNNIDNIGGSVGEQTRNAFKAGAEWQKAKDESTTEDLGEYINKLSKQFPEVSFAKLSRIAVRVAKWQREQMEKEYSNLNKGLATAKGLAVTMAYDKGMADARKAVEIAREEMIKKACEYLDLHCDEVKTEDNGIAGWIDNEFIDNFRKAMKYE